MQNSILQNDKLKAVRQLVAVGHTLRRFIEQQQNGKRQQLELCKQCVWPRREVGVPNCPFPSCIRKEAGTDF